MGPGDELDRIAAIAWLAGLLDGEGSVGISSSRGHLQPAVQVSMTHRPTIDHAADVMAAIGVKGHGYQYRETKPAHKDAHYLHVMRLADIQLLARVVAPYSVTKREQWRLIQAYVDSRLVGCTILPGGEVRRGGPGTSRRPFSAAELAIVAELRALNAKGKLAAVAA